MKSDKPCRIPFPAVEESRAFQQCSIRHVIKMLHANMTKHVDPANVKTFSHGRNWMFRARRDDVFATEEGAMELKKQDVAIQIDRIMANELDTLTDFIDGIVSGFSSQHEEDLIGLMIRTAQREGNIIDLSQGISPKEAFLKMIQAVEFSVGKNGEVIMPSLFLNPHTHEQFISELGQTDETFNIEVEGIKKEKTDAALAREQARLAKYDAPM